MQEGVIFIVLTLVLALVSRASLRKPGSHGFYRFFAWECMLGIFVMNMRYWHASDNPALQIISGILFSASLLLLLLSLALLQLSGKPDDNRDEAPMLEFEKTTALVTTGVYSYIRHPMYGSLLFLCWGIFFKQPSLLGSALGVIASGLLVVAARVEETENLRYFGEKYQEYMKRTKMFVPFIL
jgi:protein-S-isoprenylcysteine O-methyltransferase Ste14